MSVFCELNIKIGMPTVAQALDNLQSSLPSLKRRGYKCVLIVHGYGSTGAGGAICSAARRWLKSQESMGLIKAVVYGEDFEIFNFKALELKRKYKELESLCRVCNHGVTVVEL